MLRESRLGWWDIGQRSTGNEVVPTFGEITLQMEDPSGFLKEGTDFQRFRLKVRKSQALTGNPTMQVDLLSPEGNYLATPIPEVEVETTNPQVIDGTWDAKVLPNPDGANLRAQIRSSNYDGKTAVEVAAMRWFASLESQFGHAPILLSGAIGLSGSYHGTTDDTGYPVPSDSLVPSNSLVPDSPEVYPEASRYPSVDLYPEATPLLPSSHLYPSPELQLTIDDGTTAPAFATWGDESRTFNDLTDPYSGLA